ncbi:MAG: DUF4783 domain-containing protein [Bacteroidetes bacterium]|nr:DUF4783 domain-containing protein [Bacteroidota bacterium]
MKRIAVYFWIMLMSFMPMLVHGSVLTLPEDVQKEISNAIRVGNISELSRYFNTSVDLTVPGNENTFSKAQAELIMKDFFTKNPPLSFKINHQGSSKDGSLYFIGTYQTTTGKNFRTYYLIKKIGDKYLIQQLQFEPD